jgi:hypothetical protein
MIGGGSEGAEEMYVCVGEPKSLEFPVSGVRSGFVSYLLAICRTP